MPMRFPPWKSCLDGRRSLPQRCPLQRVDPVPPSVAPLLMDAYDRAIATILSRNEHPATLAQLLSYLQSTNEDLRKELADLDQRIAQARNLPPFKP